MPIPEGIGSTQIAPAPPLSRIVWALALAVLVAHVAVNAFGPYEFHRDELLYLAMGRHLQWWRMDFPPFIAGVARLTQTLGGGLQPWSVRLSSGISASALIVLAGWVARRLGGRRWAQGVAGLCLATAPVFLRAGTLFQPVVFDQWWWSLGYASLILIATDARRRWWVLAAIAVGVGLLTKFSIGFFGVGVLVGALLLPEWRRRLTTTAPWLAVGAALCIGSASIVGQLRLGWPVIGQVGDLQSTQLARIGALEFLTGQLWLGPALLFGVLGLIALLVSPRFGRIRVVGWATLASFVTLLLLRGKPYYIAPIYPVLCAVGAVVVESASAQRWTRTVRWGSLGVLLAFGVAALPFGLPFLPPAAMARYAAVAGGRVGTATNMGVELELPQDYADMLGWREMAEAVAEVYNALPTSEREQAVVVADNYGEAGALDLYGPALGLPPTISAAGSYWFFGPGTLPGEVIVALGEEPEGLRRFADSVVVAARLTNTWAVPEEQDLLILIARNPRTTLQAVWPKLAGKN